MLATLLRPVSDESRADFHAACVRKEQGETLDAEAEALYRNLLSLPEHLIVPSGVALSGEALALKASSLLFSVYMVLGTSLGFGALRIAADGNGSPELQQGGSPGETGVDELQPAQVLLLPFSRYGSPPSEFDVAIYSSPDLVEREEILQKMTECDEVFETKNQVIYGQAARFQVAHTMHAWEQGNVASVKFDLSGIPGGEKAAELFAENSLLAVGIWAAATFSLFWLPTIVLTTLAQVALFAVVVALPALALSSVWTTISCWFGGCSSLTPPGNEKTASIQTASTRTLSLSQCWMDEERHAAEN